MSAVFQIHDLPYYITALGYAGIFLFFVTIDQVTPIPEEISLLTIGYLSSKGLFNPFIAGLVAWVAFLAVDTVYYFIVRKGKKWAGKFSKKTKRSFLEVLKKKFMLNFPKALFVICFIPRMRMWGPVISGSQQIPYARFIRYDALILALFTGLYIAAGVLFQKGLSSLITELQTLQHILFFGTMLIAGIAILVAFKKYRHG